jgi:hypothetical protein
MTHTPLINWLRLEDLLARACELEVRAFGADHRFESFHAFCLEFDGFSGSLALSYGTRDAVDTAAEEGEGDPTFCYRAAELLPDCWRHRDVPRADPEAYWAAAAPMLTQYQELMAGDPDEEIAEFFWLRFEHLAESVVRRMLDRDAFHYLRREREFVAYALCREERLEELEDRIARLYPGYNRATMELVDHPRPGEDRPGICDGRTCGRSLARAELARCTYCQGWFCEDCASRHGHAELARRQSLFLHDP